MALIEVSLKDLVLGIGLFVIPYLITVLIIEIILKRSRKNGK